jgi:hypothetical protein
VTDRETNLTRGNVILYSQGARRVVLPRRSCIRAFLYNNNEKKIILYIIISHARIIKLPINFLGKFLAGYDF